MHRYAIVGRAAGEFPMSARRAPAKRIGDLGPAARSFFAPVFGPESSSRRREPKRGRSGCVNWSKL